MNRTEKYVLAVGLAKRVDAPVACMWPVLAVDTGSAALKYFRRKMPQVVISRWQLPDMPDGTLFKQILASNAGPATVALIQAGSLSEEVAARSLGVSAVLEEAVDVASLGATLSQLAEAEKLPERMQRVKMAKASDS